VCVFVCVCTVFYVEMASPPRSEDPGDVCVCVCMIHTLSDRLCMRHRVKRECVSDTHTDRVDAGDVCVCVCM
jgi:hypothetical protein